MPTDTTVDDSVLIEERIGHVSVLTLNRPTSMNAIDPELGAALSDAWDRLQRDDETWVLVLTGAGDRAFSAGADLKTPVPEQSFAGSFLGGTGPRPVTVPPNYLKPVICAVNGLAYGAGLELLLSTDIQIATPEARFCLPEAKVGSIPGAGGTQRIAHALPRGIARRMALTGEPIDADTALRLGLVSELVARESLRERALEIAERICANAPLAVRAIKKAVEAADQLTLDDGLAMEQLLWGSLRDSEDRLEGRTAFAEKRTPVYRAR
jgi:enoyl-CoA hydratase/carnithine racemase